jgi:hypothetical protein
MTLTLAASSITREPLTSTLASELRPLMAENHQAAGIEAPLSPDLWAIQAMQPRLWVVRDEGRAVGYCAHVIQPHPFFGELWASCAAIFVRDTHRRMVRPMVQQIERELRGDGVKVIGYSVPHLSRAGAFFEAMGYGCAQLVMERRLDALLA